MHPIQTTGIKGGGGVIQNQNLLGNGLKDSISCISQRGQRTHHTTLLSHSPFLDTLK